MAPTNSTRRISPGPRPSIAKVGFIAFFLSTGSCSPLTEELAAKGYKVISTATKARNPGGLGSTPVHPPQSCYGGRAHLFRKLGSLQPSCPESQSPAPKGPTQVATGEIPSAELNPWATVPYQYRHGGANDQHAPITPRLTRAPLGTQAFEFRYALLISISTFQNATGFATPIAPRSSVARKCRSHLTAIATGLWWRVALSND